MEHILKIIDKEEVHEKEIIEVVEAYIKEKKDEDVSIDLMKGIDPQHPFASPMYQAQLQKLMKAYEIASAHFKQKEHDNQY